MFSRYILVAVAILFAGSKLSAQGARSIAPESDEAAIYSRVLKHALTRYPARRNVPVVLDSRTSNQYCHPHCVDSTRVERMHSAELVKSLRAKSLIEAACVPPPGVAWSCRSYPNHDYIWAGVPFTLSPAFSIGAGQGVDMVEPVPPGTETHAEIALDVVVYGGCTKGAGCDFPNVMRYRYFLARGDDGAFRIIARMLTGQV